MASFDQIQKKNDKALLVTHMEEAKVEKAEKKEEMDIKRKKKIKRKTKSSKNYQNDKINLLVV